MQPALTVTHLFPPIAAATIVNVVLFALAWRAHQIELRTGKDPWWLGLGIIPYGLGSALFLHLRSGVPLRSYLDLFGAALIGEAFGVVVTYGLVHAFVAMRGRPWRERAFPIAASLGLTGAVFLGFITGR